MANADCLTFAEIAEYWIFCVPRLLSDRYEKCAAIARTPEEFRIVGRMLERYLEEAVNVAKRARSEGDEETATALGLVIQRGDKGRYAGPIRHDRFQVMESLTPAETFYIVDHFIPDLLLREAGPGSNVRRFYSRETAEKETDRLAERPAEITAAARRRGGLDIPPSGKGRGIIAQETEDMAKPKKAETPAKKAGATPAPKGKEASAAAPAAKGKEKGAAASPAPVAATNGAGAKRGVKSSFDPKAKIKLLKKENPKRAGSNAFELYKLYKDGMTIEAFVTAGGSGAALKYDTEHGFISVG